jgi:uncharacterized YccA/Bax inhibitor family protein
MSTTTRPTQIRTSNPAFSLGGLNAMKGADRRATTRGPADTVTVPGAALKSMILLGILMASAITVMALYLETIRQTHTVPNAVFACLAVGCIGGLVMALYTMFVPRHAPVTAPLYAVLEGLALGGITAVFEARFPGIALQALGGTFAAFLVMLALYGTGVIKVTQTFKAIVIGATLAIALFYLVAMVMGLFGARMPLLYENTALGIGISVVICIVATLNFALDFQAVIDARDAGAPRWFEWYLGFGLLLTIVWLYLEMLRLLAKLRSNER